MGDELLMGMYERGADGTLKEERSTWGLNMPKWDGRSYNV